MVYFYQLVPAQRTLENFHIGLRQVELLRQKRRQISIRLTRNRRRRYADLYATVVKVSDFIPFSPGLDVDIEQEILARPVIPSIGFHAQIE